MFITAKPISSLLRRHWHLLATGIGLLIVIAVLSGAVWAWSRSVSAAPAAPATQATASNQPMALEADIAIEKSDSPDPVEVGTALTYFIEVSNTGPDAATGVSLSDMLPNTVEFSSANTTQGSCSEAGGTVTCDLGTLSVSDTVTATIVVTPTTIGQLSNRASATGNENDPDQLNNQATESTMVVAADSADLWLTKTDSPDPALVGDPLEYTIVTGNNGPADGTEVTLSDTLPNGVVFNSASSTQGTCSEAGGTVTCLLGTIGANSTVTTTIMVTPTTSGLITNQASVSGNESDARQANNTATESTTIEPARGVDLAVAMADSSDPVGIGWRLTYTITISNEGGADASGVMLESRLPGSAAFISAQPAQGSCTESGGTVSCDMGTLAGGATTTVEIVVRPLQGGQITSSAGVQANEVDTNPTNNMASEPTTVIAIYLPIVFN